MYDPAIPWWKITMPPMKHERPVGWILYVQGNDEDHARWKARSELWADRLPNGTKAEKVTT